MGNLPSRPEPIVPAALDAAMVPSLKHLGEVPEGSVVNCARDDDAAVPIKRRKKEFVSDFLKTWFIQKTNCRLNAVDGVIFGVGKRQFVSHPKRSRRFTQTHLGDGTSRQRRPNP